MNAIKLIGVLCAVSLLVGPWLADIAEAKMRPHRRHVTDRHHYEQSWRRTSPRIEDSQRYRQDLRGNQRGSGCFSLPQLQPRSCDESNGDG
jgi:hypothetical protein